MVCFFFFSSSGKKKKKKKKTKKEKLVLAFCWSKADRMEPGIVFAVFLCSKKKKKKKMEKANDESWYGVEELVMVNLKVVVYIYLVYLSL